MITQRNAPIVFLAFCIFVAFGGMLLTEKCSAGDSAHEIDRLLALPDKKIDVGIAALTLAKEMYPDLDVRAYSAKIDKMVEGAKVLTKGKQILITESAHGIRTSIKRSAYSTIFPTPIPRKQATGI